MHIIQQISNFNSITFSMTAISISSSTPCMCVRCIEPKRHVNRVNCGRFWPNKTHACEPNKRNHHHITSAECRQFQSFENQISARMAMRFLRWNLNNCRIANQQHADWQTWITLNKYSFFPSILFAYTTIFVTEPERKNEQHIWHQLYRFVLWIEWFDPVNRSVIKASKIHNSSRRSNVFFFAFAQGRSGVFL